MFPTGFRAEGAHLPQPVPLPTEHAEIHKQALSRLPVPTTLNTGFAPTVVVQQPQSVIPAQVAPTVVRVPQTTPVVNIHQTQPTVRPVQTFRPFPTQQVAYVPVPSVHRVQQTAPVIRVHQSAPTQTFIPVQSQVAAGQAVLPLRSQFHPIASSTFGIPAYNSYNPHISPAYLAQSPLFQSTFV